MREALNDLDPVLLRIKLSAVSALAQTLRRYTSLNHLAQAARAVLKNSSQINQMLVDLSRVDFNNVQVSPFVLSPLPGLRLSPYALSTSNPVRLSRNKRLGCANAATLPWHTWSRTSNTSYRSSPASRSGRSG